MSFENDPHAGDDNPELLDRIDALRVLRASSTEQKGRLLEEIGGPGKVEQEIVSQPSKIKPLWQPTQFPETHLEITHTPSPASPWSRWRWQHWQFRLPSRHSCDLKEVPPTWLISTTS